MAGQSLTDHQVRASTLLGYPELVMALGGEPEPLMREAGIDPKLVGDTSRLVSYTAFMDLLDLSADRLKEPLFGLKLSERIPLESLGAVAGVARSADTGLQALAEIAKYIHHYSPAVHLSLRLDGEQVTMIQDLHLSNYAPRQHITDLKLGMAMNLPGVLLQQRIKPLTVSVRHNFHQYQRSYERFFACPVSFLQTNNEITYRRADLERPLPSADSLLHDLIEQRIGLETLSLDTGRSEQVRLLIQELLPSGSCSMEEIARRLMLNPRTLQRYLKAEGASFQSLLTSVRKEQAQAYLRIPNLPLAKISALLGFEEQSSFNKAFKRWFARNPGEFRSQL